MDEVFSSSAQFSSFLFYHLYINNLHMAVLKNDPVWSVSPMWFIDFSKHIPQTHMMKMDSNPPTGSQTEGEGERWCVNGCSCLSHASLFFSSLTQQSISSLLEGLLLDSSWHVPSSLRATDEGACCAECSNIAHTHTDTHTFTLMWQRKLYTKADR